jgi:hypothetical protein
MSKTVILPVAVYGYKISSLTLRRRHTGYRGDYSDFRGKEKQETEEKCIMKTHNLCSSPDRIDVIRSG